MAWRSKDFFDAASTNQALKALASRKTNPLIPACKAAMVRLKVTSRSLPIYYKGGVQKCNLLKMHLGRVKKIK